MRVRTPPSDAELPVLRFINNVQDDGERKALKRFRNNTPNEFQRAFKVYTSMEMSSAQVKDRLLEDCEYEEE